MERGADS